MHARVVFVYASDGIRACIFDELCAWLSDTIYVHARVEHRVSGGGVSTRERGVHGCHVSVRVREG